MPVVVRTSYLIYIMYHQFCISGSYMDIKAPLSGRQLTSGGDSVASSHFLLFLLLASLLPRWTFSGGNKMQSDMNLQWSHLHLQRLSFFCSLLLICLFSPPSLPVFVFPHKSMEELVRRACGHHHQQLLLFCLHCQITILPDCHSEHSVKQRIQRPPPLGTWMDGWIKPSWVQNSTM